MRLRLMATAAFGLEALVEREVMDLGYEEVLVENGKVVFSADESAVCRANIWLRCADRVLIEMGAFPAGTFDELFERCKALPWAEWIPEHGRFPVRGRSVKSQLHSVPDCQAIVKKAIVESLKGKYRLERFPETGPLFPIEVSLVKDIATLTLDTSGDGLHKRGYRKVAGAAPLKETLAAALVRLSRWQPGRPLLDPFCGSGTIPVEAALIGCNIAPGAGRTFIAESWPAIPESLWSLARQEARDMVRPGTVLDIEGSDADGDAVKVAALSATRAQVALNVRFREAAVRDIRPEGDFGCVICNPPYGERLGDPRSAEQVYRDMKTAFAPLKSWSVFVLTPHTKFERLFGRAADKRRRLYNGSIECTFYQYLGPLPPQRRTSPKEQRTP